MALDEVDQMHQNIAVEAVQEVDPNLVAHQKRQLLTNFIHKCPQSIHILNLIIFS